MHFGSAQVWFGVLSPEIWISRYNRLLITIVRFRFRHRVSTAVWLAQWRGLIINAMRTDSVRLFWAIEVGVSLRGDIERISSSFNSTHHQRGTRLGNQLCSIWHARILCEPSRGHINIKAPRHSPCLSVDNCNHNHRNREWRWMHEYAPPMG